MQCMSIDYKVLAHCESRRCIEKEREGKGEGFK